jgi:segregation and condensation protein B
VSNDERPDSLAAQAAAWVPPWERPRAEPDRAYQASHRASDDAHDDEGSAEDSVRADQLDEVEERAGELGAEAEREVVRERAAQLAELDDQAGGESRPDDDEDRSGAGLSDDDDDFDTAFEGGNPPGYGQPDSPEPASEQESRAVVDEPRELAGDDEAEPTELRLGEEVPLPEPIEEAAEAAEDDGGAPVDAPLPPEGDDAGDVFDAAADDDVSDDGEVDLPFAEVVPATDADEDAAFEADEAEFRAGSDFGGPAEADDPGSADDEAGLSERAEVDDQGAADGATGLSGEAETDGQDWSDPDDADDHELPDAEAAAGGRAGGGEAAAGGADGSGLAGAAAAYAAGAADFGAALGGAGGRHVVDGDDVSVAQPGSRPAAGDGPGVPLQGRRRRGGDGASGGGERRTSEAEGAESDVAAEALSSEMPALEDDAELAAALEAIMLVVDEPVAEMQLAQILEQPTERVAVALEDLSARYTAAGHGFDLRRAAGGWRLYTRPEYAAYVERFVLDGQSVRLTQAALETLAVVAYKQPVTRSRISAIRGVNCDGVMRTLATRGLIEECGTEGETGAHLYRTTALFLEKLGLNSVEQLPPLAPFLPDDVEEVLDATG